MLTGVLTRWERHWFNQTRTAAIVHAVHYAALLVPRAVSLVVEACSAWLGALVGLLLGGSTGEADGTPLGVALGAWVGA